MLKQIDIQSDAIATRHIAEITSESKSAYVQALNKGESLAAALAAADAAAESLIDELVDDANHILSSGYINHGRGVVFDRAGNDIHAFQRSEILDESTCNYCLSIDGRIIEKDDPFGQKHNLPFQLPRHMGRDSGRGGVAVNWRIPQSLRDRFRDAVNDLLQPKKPMPKRR